MPNTIERITIDSSDAMTELCFLGKSTGSDKSPYNTCRHRHPYTAVYNMLFSPLKNQPIHFAEIGVAAGCSAILWDLYFTHEGTRLHYFDREEGFLENGRGLTSSRTKYSLMDVSVDGDVVRALKGSRGEALYDVILDDSSHEHGHQIRIIKEAFPLLKQGGLLIVEDIFRSIPEEEYSRELTDILPQCSAAYFILCEHKYKFSPGWDNDKLLVLVKE
jgi:predicted O-methyltransferase YrrM